MSMPYNLGLFDIVCQVCVVDSSFAGAPLKIPLYLWYMGKNCLRSVLTTLHYFTCIETDISLQDDYSIIGHS